MAETDGDAAPRPAVLERVHVVDGRARLRLRRPLSREALQELIDRISGLAGVTRVLARPNTGSVIVKFDGTAEEMMLRLAGMSGVKLADPPGPPPVGQVAQLGLMRLDSGIQSRTDGALDFRSALAVLLVFAAIVQAARGRIAGPTTTLLMSALSLLNAPTGRRGE